MCLLHPVNTTTSLSIIKLTYYGVILHSKLNNPISLIIVFGQTETRPELFQLVDSLVMLNKHK